eukprot:896880-Rhodomonas_salina.2
MSQRYSVEDRGQYCDTLPCPIEGWASSWPVNPGGAECSSFSGARCTHGTAAAGPETMIGWGSASAWRGDTTDWASSGERWNRAMDHPFRGAGVVYQSSFCTRAGPWPAR